MAQAKHYKSFQEQALHYFQRDHQGMPTQPVMGRAAWRGVDVAGDGTWPIRLDAVSIEELDQAYAAAHRRGVGMRELGREDFPLPGLKEQIDAWREELAHGRGFVFLRGLPVSRWGEEKSAYVYWGLGLHLGWPGAQNAQEELLGHVVNTGEDAATPFIRRYRTAANIAYHCDLADVVGLLCLHTAKSGGASRVVSSVSVFNELLGQRPDLAARLFEPLLLDLRDESDRGPGYIPVYPCRFAGGVLRTFYHSDYFRSVTRHADVPPFTAEEQELLDLYEAIADTSALRLDMQFQEGDIQLISNHFLLHSRTEYEDHPEPERRRHLLRLWLSL